MCSEALHLQGICTVEEIIHAIMKEALCVLLQATMRLCYFSIPLFVVAQSHFSTCELFLTYCLLATSTTILILILCQNLCLIHSLTH